MKKYLLIGTLIVLSFAVLAPKVFVPQAHALIDCGLDACTPNTFSCDDSTGVCAIDNPGGEFVTRGQCRSFCKPAWNSFSISPSSVTYGTPVSVSWNFTGGGISSCTGYVDGSSAGPVPATMNGLQLGLPGPAGNLGSHSAYITCTNPSGSTTSPTRFWTVNAPPKEPVTTLTLSPSTVKIGDYVTATWSSTNGATSCTPTVDNANGIGVTTYPDQFGPSGTYNLLSWNVKGTFGMSLYCTNANGNGATVRKTVNVTGTLSIDPQNSAVDVGGILDYAAFYNDGSGIQVIGSAANLTSSDPTVIGPAAGPGGNPRVSFKGHKEGTATISGSYDGLNASTPVTVTHGAYNINFSATPNQLLYWNLSEHGGTPYPINIDITGAPPSSWGNLSRTEYQYNNYINVSSPHTTKTTVGNQWKSTDASGENHSTSNHSCDNDGTNNPVKGYRIEADTKVTFPGAGTSNSLNVTKDCRGTIVVQNPQGSSWTANGPTPADYSNVSTIQQYSNLGGGSVRYGVTDGGYTVTGLSSYCSVAPVGSQSVIPGQTITFTISCAGNPTTHFECIGNSCMSVQGGGGNLNGCTGGGQACSGGTQHLACVSSSCAIVAGGGANQDGCAGEGQNCAPPGTPSVTVTPSPQSCIPGGNNTFYASYTNSSRVTTNNVSATWVSSNPSKATIPAGPAVIGLAHCVAAGVTNIRATYAGTTSGPANLTVNSGDCNGNFWVGAPTSATIGAGSGHQFSTYFDPNGSGIGNDVSNATTWTSANPAVASVGSAGYVSGISPGGPVAINTRYVVGGCTYTDNSARVTVTAGGTDNAVCSSVTAPDSVPAGQAFAATVVMKNIGTNTWTPAGNYHLGTQNPQDNKHWLDPSYPNQNRVFLPGGSSIATNQNATFAFTGTANLGPGTYPFAWKMVNEGIAWFGATCTKNITVTGGPSHNICQSNSCTSVSGGGANQCSPIGSPCGGPVIHYSCSGASCIVDAGGSYTTSNCDGACVAGGPHKECVNNACTSVAGAGSDRCAADADCGGGTPPPPSVGSICDAVNRVCKNVAGGGNVCSNDPACGGAGGNSHLECQRATCVIVGGAGSNDCNAVGAACSACTLTAAPSAVNPGGSTKLTWKCGAGVSGCSINNGIGSIDPYAANPSVTVKPAKSTTYTLSCTKGGAPVTANAAVKVFTIIECNPNDPTCKP